MLGVIHIFVPDSEITMRWKLSLNNQTYYIFAIKILQIDPLNVFSWANGHSTLYRHILKVQCFFNLHFYCNDLFVPIPLGVMRCSCEKFNVHLHSSHDKYCTLKGCYNLIGHDLQFRYQIASDYGFQSKIYPLKG